MKKESIALKDINSKLIHGHGGPVTIIHTQKIRKYKLKLELRISFKEIKFETL